VAVVAVVVLVVLLLLLLLRQAIAAAAGAGVAAGVTVVKHCVVTATGCSCRCCTEAVGREPECPLTHPLRPGGAVIGAARAH